MLEMLSTIVVSGKFKPSTDFIVIGGGAPEALHRRPLFQV
jgi:hypothetical protein